MSTRIVLLVTSPRLPAGLLTAEAWDTVRAYPVYAAADSAQADALRVTGVPVTVLDTDAQGLLDAVAGRPAVVWLAGPDGDQTFARQLGLRLAREPGLAELELMYGSWDPPGARLLDAVTVMDRLASPGGDPWKREQTHLTLAPYLLEESYEAYDAITGGDLGALREELGDVLLQVLLHARLAEDRPESDRWSVDDVAGGLVEKMIRRNPHVFGGEQITDIEEITANWERIKREEKARDSVLDGIALSQPALALAAKILHRVERGGLSVPLPSDDDLGSLLLRVVAEARAAGLDAEAALRAATLLYAEAVRAAER
ncbi:nucleoside triphosphate pyrophosphohydrolase [Actinoplanes xinjiangensis]|uniref:XTP/dITP diphosphohydrolase n=1 Tax=Actinoplanes xinjiangensis TaxID=512350 RepID=A0A316F8N0_9ACTN|nr:nucleoside triphosphate pyrophosphohydrolase [Actinoplanes xinjiangensis]PWK40819.1 XTP/dITP diphosphohydrolase [Actinoplanes xinjiangensis]GIF43331.1 nucleoside triphosphate pyrophosphohydrolase [Actinoplanes xinjiangensis]